MRFYLRLLFVLVISLLINMFVNFTIMAKQHIKADVVMFGDSLIENGKWEELFPDITIVNLGVGGNSTYDVLIRLKQVYKYNPKYCVIMAGFNDIDCYRDFNETYNDYISILKKLKKRGITPVIMSTTYAADFFKPDENINTKIENLNNALKEYAMSNEIIFIDLNKSVSKNHYLSREFAADHVHLNEKGYEVWRDKIKNIIYKKQPQS